MKLKFETYRYADISTGYIKKKDSEILTECARPHGIPNGPIVYDYEEGYFVWVPQGNPEGLPEYLNECKRVDLSEQFCLLVKECVEQGCTFLRLDRDGGEVDGLGTYDW